MLFLAVVNLQLVQVLVAEILKKHHDEKIVYFALNSIKHNIKVDQQRVFSFSITCVVPQILSVLKHANSL